MKTCHSNSFADKSFHEQSALLASLLASAFTWPFVPEDAFQTKALWFVGLGFVLGSVTTATQLCIALYRLSALDERGWQDLKEAFESSVARSLYVWQIPLLMLRLGILSITIGTMMLLWQPSVAPTRLAVAFTLVTVLVLIYYLFLDAYCVSTLSRPMRTKSR